MIEISMKALGLDQERVAALSEAETRLFHCDFCPYLELKELLHDPTARGREQFCVLFSNFYGMNSAGLTDEFTKKYFEIIFEGVAMRDGKPDYSSILCTLSEIKRRKKDYAMPFSFVSKLIAMHLDDRPICDRHVLAFFGEKLPIASMAKQERIRWFVCFLEQVRASYQAWAQEERVIQILNRFRARDARLHDCDAVRLIDFLVWKVGNQKLLPSTRREMP